MTYETCLISIEESMDFYIRKKEKCVFMVYVQESIDRT